MANIIQARPDAVICGIDIFISLHLVQTRLNKYLRGYVITPPTRPLTMGLNTTLLGIDEVKRTKLFKKIKTDVYMTEYWQCESHPLHWSNTVGHRWGKDNTSIWVNEDQRTHDWAPMRQKSSSSSTHHVHIRRGDDTVMTEFRQYKSHYHTFHTWAILYMKTITHTLIRSFLQTRSVDIINRVCFSHKTPRIGEPHISEVRLLLKHWHRRPEEDKFMTCVFYKSKWLLKYMIPHHISEQELFYSLIFNFFCLHEHNTRST
jgi:hypothetical protein